MLNIQKPTKEDASLLLQLYTAFPRDSYHWFSNEFSAEDYEEFMKKYPRGSDDYRKVIDVLGFFEMAGVLISQGVLNEDLFLDLSFGLTPFWKKAEPIISGWQKAHGQALWENAAWLAKRYETWNKEVWKPHFEWKLPSQVITV